MPDTGTAMIGLTALYPEAQIFIHNICIQQLKLIGSGVQLYCTSKCYIAH